MEDPGLLLPVLLCRYHKDDLVVIGFGNLYRSDDGFGIGLAETLKQKAGLAAFTETDLDEVVLGLCGETAKKLVLFVDAADFGGKEGEMKMFCTEELQDQEQSSHKIPLKLYMKLLEKSGHKTYLIALQPQNLEEVEEPVMSPKAEKAMKKLLEIMERGLN